MPTISQLIKRTEYLIDDRIDVSLAIDFFNEAIADLSTVAGIEKKTTISMSANEGMFTLPDDFVEMIAVYVIDRDSTEKAKLVTERDLYQQSDVFTFRLFGNEVEISPKPKQPYEITVEYFSRIPKLPNSDTDASLTAIPQFDERFHRALSIYCALQYAENDDNSYKRQNLQETYTSIREEMLVEYWKRKTRTRSKTVNIDVGWF